MDKDSAMTEITELLQEAGFEDGETLKLVEAVLEEYENDHYEEAFGEGYDQCLSEKAPK